MLLKIILNSSVPTEELRIRNLGFSRDIPAEQVRSPSVHEIVSIVSGLIFFGEF